MAIPRRATPVAPRDHVRLVDLLAGLTLVNDLGMAQPPEESLRSALVASGLARALDLDGDTVAGTFYTALLQHVGCTGFAHESAAMLGGDDRAINAAGARTNFDDPKDMFATFLPELTSGVTVVRRVRLVSAALARGSRVGRGVDRANCEVAAAMSERLGLGEGVRVALLHAFEWWNGKGGPGGVAGEDIPLPMRLAQVASVAVLFCGLDDAETACAALRRRAGGALDPDLVAAFERWGRDLLAEAFAADAAPAVLAAEPPPVRTLSVARMEEAARAFGQVVDLKSPWLHGHADAVAALAQAAGAGLGLDEAADGRLRLAGLLHDLGRVGIASGVWGKPSALSRAEREQVQLHAYHSERILAGSPALRPVAALVGAHHERCDGSGYHRASTSEQLPMAARVLAAADAFAALTHDRPHRPALEPDAAAAVLQDEARSGRLDTEAVHAVLTAAGGSGASAATGAVRAWPADLTDRQVEVLRLLCRGDTNRQIARGLGISPRTAEHHVQAIYTRIGVSSRAAAAMFAMQHGLVGP
jgi:HD-GYP domain-containing protein (c-di-GMP phosphodiesterase class II)/DNA-binding CsgD family transcriptional regulator